MQYQRVFWAVVLGIGLALALLGVLSARPEAALAGTLCVNPGGSGGCYASIQAAVDAASDDDTIRVAAGTYYEAVVITKSVTLEGGWNADFSARNWELYVTTIDAQRIGPVIWFNAPVAATIEGFTLTGGDDTAGLGWGGGIKIYWSYIPELEGFITVRHNVITNNVACTDAGCQGHGGGVFVYRSTALIENNTIISNAARAGGDGGGQGGGVRVWTANATLIGNTIVSNTAVYSATGGWTGQGGGVGTEWANSVTLVENEIRGNVAAVKGDGYGGGVWANAYMHGNRILSNTASVHGDGYGGGVYAYHAPEFDDNLVQGNVASENSDGSGGGIYGVYLKHAQHNAIVNNVATRGGGIYLEEYMGSEALYYNFIAYNHAAGTADSDGGGGIASAADWVEIVGNEIYSNTTAAFGAGGGLLIIAGDRYVVRDNRFEDNLASGGGGIAVYTATGAIVQNQIVSNTALFGGGMYLGEQASPELDRNEVVNNTAYGFLGVGGGGGLMVNVQAGTVVTLTNNIIARNAAGASGNGGGGVFCWRGDCVLINNSIVDNDRGDYKEGVILGSSYGGTHTVWNNIIVGHSVGIRLASGTATLDYNDHYDNFINVSGTTWGTHHRTDKPEFEERLRGDYHLTLTSPLIDQGDSTVDVPFDFEGDPRPRGGGIDIGADEAYRAESYVSEVIGDDSTGDGSSSKPFKTVTKGIDETRTGGAVIVGRGQYTETLAITRSVALLGGFHETGWGRDISANVTTLDAQGAGTVVLVHGEGVNATIEGFTITGGEASMYGSGGGLAVYGDATANVRHNVIADNHAKNGGGGVMLWGNEFLESVLDSNRIYGNLAEGVFVPGRLMGGSASVSLLQGPEPGGGVLLGGGLARVVNNWVYSNTAEAGGDGMALSGWNGPVLAYHNTVVDNGGSSGVGIQVMGPAAGVILRNNLIVGHGTGITATTGGEVAWDYNGFYDNMAAYGSGLSGGAHDRHGNPYFANRSGGDYHISGGSLIVGAGVDVGVEADLDGDPRPLPEGTRPDLGADETEQLLIYLPLVLRNS